MTTNFCYRSIRIIGMLVLVMAFPARLAIAAPAQKPLYLGYNSPPLMLLTMQRDHRLFYPAYDNISDINGDGIIDTYYRPNLLDISTNTQLDYYGYFDSYKCYTYNSKNKRFVPSSTTLNKKCSGNWSGDFLNYLTMTRIDTLRKVLYGGKRSTDNGPGSSSTANLTVLERAYIPAEGHMFGKDYTSLAVDGFAISDYTPFSAPSSGGRHLFANMTLNTSTDPLLRVATNVGSTSSPYYIWDWISKESPMGDTKLQDGTSVTPTDYVVRVEVCNKSLLETNCTGYPQTGTITTYKPTGILHSYGENNSMYFGLLTGSYTNNLQGGVLRRTIGSFQNEINLTTGQFSAFTGIVTTLNALKITGYTAGSGNTGGSYDSTKCPFSTIIQNPLSNGKCTWWGNPIAEMMYEGLRYFSGTASPTSGFTYSITDSTLDDNILGLPLYGDSSNSKPWDNPYDSSKNNWCAKPIQTVISDTMPTFDSDNLPGVVTAFSGSSPSTLGTFSAVNVDQIWNAELGSGPRNIIIGESTTNQNLAPTPKTTSGFSTIRGLTPEDPNKQGSYNAAAVAAYGKVNDINASKQGIQKIDTFVIALSATTPRIQIPVTVTNTQGQQVSQTVIIVPYGKTVSTGGRSNTEPSTGLITTPQNTGVLRMYVESIKNVPPFTSNNLQDISDNGGRPHYRFRVEFGDTEYGNDYDMDALALYDIKLNSDNTITVYISVDNLADTGAYAQAGYDMHIGYVISGTTNNGVKLLIRNPSWDTSAGNVADVRYQLDGDCATDPSPAICAKNMTKSSLNGHNNDSMGFKGQTVSSFTNQNTTYQYSLPFSSSKTFSPTAPPIPQTPPVPVTDGEYILHDPLWYAAKWGGFLDGYDPTIDIVNTSSSTYNNQLDPGEWEKRNDNGTIKCTGGQSSSSPTSACPTGTTPLEPRNYFPVTNASNLNRVLDKAFESAISQLSSSSAAATNSGYAQTPDKIYQAKFNPLYWNGQLLAYAISQATGEIDTSTIIFDAGSLIPADKNDLVPAQSGNRKIYTYRPVADFSDLSKPSTLDKPQGGFEFVWNNFSYAELAFLNRNNDTSLTSINDRQSTLAYLRGERNWTGCQVIAPATTCTNYSEASGAFRKRNADINPASNDIPILGDIINSAPVYVGAQNYGYGSAADLPGYTDFITTIKQTRRQMLYAGANDGMLHAFDAKTGIEQFAYIPRAVFSGVGANKLSNLTRKSFPHQYTVDGPISVNDVYIDGHWKSILVGTLGAGGNIVYALDVTDPDQFDGSKVLWEFSHPELGYVTGQPLIVRLNDGNWYAVIGNGYESQTCDKTPMLRYSIDSTTGLPTCTNSSPLDTRNAKLFFIKLNPNLTNGWDNSSGDYFVIHATDNQVVPSTHTEAVDNALSGPAGLTQLDKQRMTGDLNFDFKTDVLYAGDLQGNLWRFDLTASTSSGWTARSIFQAVDSSSNKQPISATPAVMSHPTSGSGYIVLFGTGLYLYGSATGYADDPANKNTQSLYGIWDNTSIANPTWSVSGRSQLQQQTILQQIQQIFGSYTYNIRNVSINTVNWSSKKGWYLDLLQPASAGTPQQGERVTEAAQFLGSGRVLFNTKIPSTDACTAGGSSWAMEIDAGTGARVDTGNANNKTFDLNQDQSVNSLDNSTFGGVLSTAVVVSGIQRVTNINGSGGATVCGMTQMGTPYCNAGKSLIRKTFSCTNGSLYTETDAASQDFCGTSFKRTSWRELQ